MVDLDVVDRHAGVVERPDDVVTIPPRGSTGATQPAAVVDDLDLAGDERRERADRVGVRAR